MLIGGLWWQKGGGTGDWLAATYGEEFVDSHSSRWVHPYRVNQETMANWVRPPTITTV